MAMMHLPHQADAAMSGREQDLDESTRTFLRFAITAILGCALTFIAVILIFAPEQTWRIVNPAAAIGIALSSWALLKTDHTRAGIVVLTFGTWTAATLIAITTGGIQLPVVFCLPVIIFFTGWILGSRTAVFLAALSVVVYLAIAVAEYRQLLPAAPPTSPFMYWVVQATIFSLAAAAIIHLRDGHARQVEEVRTLTAELARQRAEAAAAETLRNSLNNLQRTLEATDEGIFGYDGTDPEGRLLFANDRLFELWQIPLEDAPHTGRAGIIDAARKLFIDPDAEVRRIEEILAMGVVHEDKVTLNDGRVLFRRSIPLRAGSQVSRVWSFRDITAEERSKAVLQVSRDEAQRANAAKSEFLSRMSHELRTPLHGIMGMIALARRRMTDARGLEQLDKAKAAADHLLAVISDILDISKIEAGHMQLEKVAFRPAEVLESVVNLVGYKAADKGLRLLIDCTPGILELRLLGDPLRLGQILLNLAGNAVKFTESGTITIRLRRTEAQAEQLMLRFEVEDSGIGVSAEDSRRLFVAFEQADGSMTRKYGGTGLGLAISRKLAQLMGGEIDFESLPAGGSRFRLSARFDIADDDEPAAPPPSLTASAETLLRSRHPGARLLLAEDEPVGREIAIELLHSAGLQVDAAEDGEVALSLARSQRYDLILMDMRMPRLNGVEATQAIRFDSRNTATPILAMTANAFDSDRRLCLDAGMNDHISKPVEPALLFQTILRWLDQGRSAPAPGAAADTESA